MSVRRFRIKRHDPVEDALRAGRGEPSDEFLDEWRERTAPRVAAPARRWSRAAFAGALTVFMLGTFASFGGMSYAASSAQGTVRAVQHAVAPKAKAARHSVAARESKSAAEDQYGEQESVEPAVEKTTPKPSSTLTPPTAVVKTTPKPSSTLTPPTATKVEATVASPPPTSSTLPFTGFGLAATGALGALLLALGIFLRRHESRS